MPPRDPAASDDPNVPAPISRPRTDKSREKAPAAPKSSGDAAETPKRVRSDAAPTRSSSRPSKSTAQAAKLLFNSEDDEDLEDLSPIERLQKFVTETATGLTVSVAIHLVVFFLLGLIVYTKSEGLESTSGLISTWLSPSEAEGERQQHMGVETVEIESVKVESVTAAPTGKGTGQAQTETPAEAPTSAIEKGFSVGAGGTKVGNALGGRGSSQKGSLLKLFGGTKQSEDAVGRGLAWLARQQQSDGRWELHRGYDNPGRENLRTDTGATALALLCYLGAGYTHQDGKYKEVVRKGLNWLKKIQKPDGDLHDWQELGRQTAFYAHGQGTIVLCEAYGMTRDSSLQEPANKALKFIYESQNEHGGWQYQPGAVGDLSVTGWQVMALQSARMAQLEVPEEVLTRIQLFLDSVSSQGGRRYRYKSADPESLFSPAMTAEGLLCRQYLGWKKEHPALQDGVQWLLEAPNLPQWSEGRRNVYYWYYATQVMHHMEGPQWEKWNSALRDQISSAQVKSGKLGGSWHPSKPAGDNHEYGEAGGRLYITCLSILTLEVYYRHLPLYRDPTAEAPKAE